MTSRPRHSSGAILAPRTKRHSRGWASGTRSEQKARRSAPCSSSGRPVQPSSASERSIRNLERRRSAARLRPPGRHHCIHQLMRVSARPPSSIAKVTTGRSGSRSTPHACAIRRACSTWRVSSPILGASSTCLTSWPPAKLRSTCPAIPVDPAWCLTREMPARCSMRAPKRRIAGGSQRSTRTLRRRGRWRMLTGRRKLMPNANVWSGNWPVQSDSAGAIDVRRQHLNAPEARSPGLSAMALARIREHDASLGEHLDHAIRTGTYCAYLSDSRVPVVWKL